MSKKHAYTPEQMEILSQNPFTHKVTPMRLVFTLEFKQFFLDQILNQKKTTNQALRAAGYEPSWFTLSQKNSIRLKIQKQAKSEGGLRPPRGLSAEAKLAAFEKKDLSKQKTDETLKEMQERIVQLEKQISFLKKNSSVIE